MEEPDYRLLKQLDREVATARAPWMLMDRALLPNFPLVVLEDVDFAGFYTLEAELSAAGIALRQRKLEQTLA